MVLGLARLGAYIWIYVLDSPGKDLAGVLGPVRAARELVDERVCDLVVFGTTSVPLPLFHSTPSTYKTAR